MNCWTGLWRFIHSLFGNDKYWPWYCYSLFKNPLLTVVFLPLGLKLNNMLSCSRSNAPTSWSFWIFLFFFIRVCVIRLWQQPTVRALIPLMPTRTGRWTLPTRSMSTHFLSSGSCCILSYWEVVLLQKTVSRRTSGSQRAYRDNGLCQRLGVKGLHQPDGSVLFLS